MNSSLSYSRILRKMSFFQYFSSFSRDHIDRHRYYYHVPPISDSKDFNQKYLRLLTSWIRIKNYGQDYLEEENYTGGEASCPKYIHHSKYISVNELIISDIPGEINHPSVYHWMLSISPLVLKLVNPTKGTATGRVTFLPEYTDKVKICDAPDCPRAANLGRNHLVYGGLGVITNKHVVNSDIDAENTQVIFFYDEESPEKNTVTEKGYHLVLRCSSFDYAVFSCYVHDLEFIEQMKKSDEKRNQAWLQIPKGIRLKAKNYAIVVSHPHGNHKRFSFGKTINTVTVNNGIEERKNAFMISRLQKACTHETNIGGVERFNCYLSFCLYEIKLPRIIKKYDATTCKGSSGAPVYMGNTDVDGEEEINQAYTHSSSNTDKAFSATYT